MIGINYLCFRFGTNKRNWNFKKCWSRKKDVSNVFNAETLIIGFASGFFGILITYLLSIPANIILERVIDIKNVVSLPILPALALILISMILTVFSGLIPARLAAKKDPVKGTKRGVT